MNIPKLLIPAGGRSHKAVKYGNTISGKCNDEKSVYNVKSRNSDAMAEALQNKDAQIAER